jgi:hypothetical protein
MAKDFYLEWYPLDWFKDTRSLSLTAKGFWFECLNYMHMDNFYEISGTYESFSRRTGGTVEETRQSIKEITVNNVCDIREDNGVVTLKSRRFERLYKLNKGNNLRQERFKKKHKGNGKVTEEKQESNADGNAKPSIILNPKVLNPNLLSLNPKSNLTARMRKPGSEMQQIGKTPALTSLIEQYNQLANT